ncbi:MAG: hypothetical protein WKG03_21355, partial [Telluria sp.]
EIGVVIDFQGLFGATSKGKIVQATATLQYEYRLFGTTPWLSAPIGTGRQLNYNNGEVRTNNRDPFTVSVSWKVASGQYEVRVTRGGTNWAGADGSTLSGDAVFSGLRSIRATNPSTT